MTHVEDGVASEPGKQYDAFISYSHAADGQFAPLLQHALQRFAKSWRQRRALEVFRDKTGLAISPDLWAEISRSLDRSSWFIYLASPAAAASEWVGREIARWKATKDPERILVVLTDGDWTWDSAVDGFDPLSSTAIHPELRHVFPSEPLVLDMRWAHAAERLTLRDARFRDAVAEIAAPIHGRAKDDLEDEDTRAQRRVRRIARAGVVLLACLLVLALVAGWVALQQRDSARSQLRVSEARQLAATSGASLTTQLGTANLLAVEAYAMNPDQQTRHALFEAVTASPRLVRFQDAGATVTALASSGDGRTVVLGLDSAKVLIWRPDGTVAPRRVLRLGNPVSAVAVDRTGGVVAATDGRRVEQIGVPFSYEVPDGLRATDVAVSPSGATTVIYEQGDASPGRLVVVSGGQAVPVADADNGPGDQRITYSDENTVTLFNAGGQWKRLELAPVPEVIQERSLGFGVHDYAAAMSADGDTVTYTNSAAHVPLWHPSSGVGPVDFDRPDLIGESAGRSPNGMALSADGSMLAVADGGTIYVSQTHSPTTEGSPPEALTGNAVLEPGLMEFLGSQPRLVSASGRRVALWDMQQSSRISSSYRLVVPTSCTACRGPVADVDAAGEAVAVTSAENYGGYYLQHLGDGKPVASISNDYQTFWGPPAFSHDGRLFMPSSEDRIDVRDVGTGRLLARWRLGLAPGLVVADGVTLDGKALVLVAGTGVVQTRGCANRARHRHPDGGPGGTGWGVVSSSRAQPRSPDRRHSGRTQCSAAKRVGFRGSCAPPRRAQQCGDGRQRDRRPDRGRFATRVEHHHGSGAVAPVDDRACACGPVPESQREVGGRRTRGRHRGDQRGDHRRRACSLLAPVVRGGSAQHSGIRRRRLSCLRRERGHRGS